MGVLGRHECAPPHLCVSRLLTRRTIRPRWQIFGRAPQVRRPRESRARKNCSSFVTRILRRRGVPAWRPTWRRTDCGGSSRRRPSGINSISELFPFRTCVDAATLLGRPGVRVGRCRPPVRVASRRRGVRFDRRSPTACNRLLLRCRRWRTRHAEQLRSCATGCPEGCRSHIGSLWRRGRLPPKKGRRWPRAMRSRTMRGGVDS